MRILGMREEEGVVDRGGAFVAEALVVFSRADAAGMTLDIEVLTAFGLEFRKQTFLGEWELPPGTVVLGRVPSIRIVPSTAKS